MAEVLPEDVQTALFDLQRYLMDQVPPLTIIDSIEGLITLPPALAMRQIHSWAVETSRAESVGVTDCLFHAIKKIYFFAALKLIDRAKIDAYVNGLTPLAMQVVPPEDRESFNTNLQAMRNSNDFAAAAGGGFSKESLAHIKPKAATPPPSSDSFVGRTARRISAVMDRLSKLIPGGKPAAPSAPAPGGEAGPPPDMPAAHLLTMAAASSTSDKELESFIQTLQPVTGEADPLALIRLLANSAPRWEIQQAKPSAPVQAIEKIVSLTKDTMEVSKRFRVLVTTAVDQFNADVLPVAVSMLEVAERLILEKKLDPSTVDRIRNEAADSLSAEQLKKYTENVNRHVLLRKALTFFPSLRVETLMQDLRGEERPERRRSLLGLLEAHGNVAREKAISELDVELKRKREEQDTYYLRNVIYLMHRIPSETEGPAEMELLTRSSARNQSIYVIKEAVVRIGQLKTDAAVKLLTMRLAETESMLLKNDPLYPVEEMQKLLDRIVAALGRIGTPSALLTVARHGIKPAPILGDTRGRLTVLAQHDLSFDEKTVDVIIKMIRDDLPKKILGKILPSLQPAPVKLIEALSGTRSESVEGLLRELSEKFIDHDIGKAALTALARFAEGGRELPSDKKKASLTGDLQFFGLPTLMQSLAEQQASGIVTLAAKNGQTAGKMLFIEGKFAEAQAAHLRGNEALYQLLEKPIVGTFSFVPQPPSALPTKSTPVQVMGLLLEGIRRHDELKQVSMFVPDDLVVKATGVKPTPDGEDIDPAIMRDVWVKATGGTKVSEWEPQVAADSYRIRRLVAHWLDAGALQTA